GDLVTVDLSAFSTGLSLTQTSPPGGTTFEGEFTLPQMDGIEGTNYPFTVNVMDNAGNTSSRTVYLSAISLDPPVQSTAEVQVLNQDMTPSPDTDLASVGMHLSFSSYISSTLEPSVTVNLSAIGGDANTVASLTSPFVPNTSMLYMATYTIPAGAIENVSLYAFQITAKDSGGNTVYKSTTPSIRIDNNPPVISALSVSSSGGAGIIHIGDVVTIDATVTGVEGPLGSVSADLRELDGTAARRVFSNISGNTWRTFFTVATSPDQLDSTAYAVKLLVTDDVRNVASMESALLDVDNIPPEYLSSAWSVNRPLVAPDLYVRIGDQLTLDVFTNVTPVPHTVKVDLTSIGSGTPTLNRLAAGQYQLIFTVPEGPRDLNATLPIIITDDAGNTAFNAGFSTPATTPFSLPMFDQLPPQPSGRLNLAVTRRDPAIDTLGLNVINLNRSLAFGWPVSNTGRDVPGSCTIDLSYVGSNTADSMVWRAGPPASYGSFLDSADASLTSGLSSDSYSFSAIMTDKAGNMISTTTAALYVVDCIPPVLSSLSVQVVSGGVATIGQQILFKATVGLNDSNAPTINLTSLGGTANQQMTLVSGGDYSYPVTVPAGTWESTTASWVITISDVHGNSVSSSTNSITIDNKPPQAGTLQVTWADTLSDGRIKLGDAASFTIAISDLAAQAGTATVDLTAIGSGSAEPMIFAGGNFSIALPATLVKAAEYLNYTFTARVSDVNGNLVTVTSAPISEVDCQAPGFASCGIYISQNNGDNPVSTVANTGDIVTVYASISSSLDAVASASISSGSISLATGTMTYIAARNRHEVSFTVPAGSGIWNLGFAPLTFQATATDNVGNSSWTTPVQSDFTVKNKLPAISTFSFDLNPNVPFASIGSIFTLNVGSGTVVDKLTASATLANDEIVTSGILDLSQVPGAPAALPLAFTGSWGGTASVDLSKYPLSDWRTATFTITLRDQAGNPVSTGTQFFVDTRRPGLVGARFDGTLFNIEVSEPYDMDSVASGISEWRLIGSHTNGTLASLSLPAGGLDTNPGSTFFDASLSLAERKIISGWASTPLYLEIRSVATAPLTDWGGNWLPGYTRFPVTITNSTWREPARLTNFIVDTTNWNPASGIGSISLDLYFDRAMATDTLVASRAVLLVSPIGYEFSNIDYPVGYVFQPADLVSSTWPSADRLHIELCENGRDWVARKLGSGTAVLRFANRTATSVFVRDSLDKPATVYPTTAPFASSAVSRPAATAFIVQDPPNNLMLDLASGTLDVTLSERALLYTNGFYDIDGTNPTMGIATPTYAKRTTRFHSKFVLYDTGADPATFARLVLQPLATDTNIHVSSTTIHLKLTDADTANVIAMFRSNPAPVWGMRVDAGAFGNWWDQPSQLYLPSGNPGSMVLIPPTSPGIARLAAAAISDPPRTKNATAGTLFFEFDFEPNVIGNTPVPLSSAAPTARIASASGETLATGTFVNWTTRTIAGKTRYTARYSNQTSLPDGYQNINGQLEIWNVSDIFGNIIHSQAVPAATSTVYDLNLRSTTDARGFSSGTAPLAIDTATPTVLSITPATIARADAGALLVTVTLSEAMDTSLAAPVLTIATTTPVVQSLAFSAGVWGAGGTSITYTNTSAIPATLVPQGDWQYSLAASGRDLAGNSFGGHTSSVAIRTNVPPVTAVQLRLTKQFLTATPTVDIPAKVHFSPTAATGGNATVQLSYSAALVNTPHRLRLTRNDTGASTSVLIASIGLQATATVTDAEFGNPGLFGPASYLAQVYDSQGNITDVATFVYDSIAPDLSYLNFSGIGSQSGFMWY
ncbi:MAG TPA: hypothetical protein PKM25_03235, partial [Candidatus Ozemobacteraceae bacterium]|nr:hypothetical protein [Candidatus Ozemobacteraceae bacterium]